MNRIKPKRYWLTVENIQAWAQGIVILFFTYFVMINGVYSLVDHLVTKFLVLFLFVIIWTLPSYLMRRPIEGDGGPVTLQQLLSTPIFILGFMFVTFLFFWAVSFFSLVLLPYAGTIYLTGAIGYALWDWNGWRDTERLRLLSLGIKIVFYLGNYFVVMSYLRPAIDMEIISFGHALYYPFWITLLVFAPVRMLDPLDLVVINRERDKNAEIRAMRLEEEQEQAGRNNQSTVRYSTVIPFSRPERKRR